MNFCDLMVLVLSSTKICVLCVLKHQKIFSGAKTVGTVVFYDVSVVWSKVTLVLSFTGSKWVLTHKIDSCAYLDSYRNGMDCFLRKHHSRILDYMYSSAMMAETVHVLCVVQELLLYLTCPALIRSTSTTVTVTLCNLSTVVFSYCGDVGFLQLSFNLRQPSLLIV